MDNTEILFKVCVDCVQCGESFQVYHAKKICCSKDCSTKYFNALARQKKKEQK